MDGSEIQRYIWNIKRLFVVRVLDLILLKPSGWYRAERAR